jgi:hypothetical protein
MTSIAIHLFDADLAFFAELAAGTGTTRADVIRELIAAARTTPAAMRKVERALAHEEPMPSQVTFVYLRNV